MSDNKFKFVALTGVTFTEGGKRVSVSPKTEKGTGLFNAPFEVQTIRRLISKQHIRLATAADHASLAALRTGYVAPAEPEVIEEAPADDEVVDEAAAEQKRIDDEAAAEQKRIDDEAAAAEKARIDQEKADEAAKVSAEKARIKQEKADQKAADAAAKAKLKADANTETNKSTSKSSDLL